MSASDNPDRASVINVGLTGDHLGVYTWTGNPKPGEGQSSVEGYVLVTGIKPAYFEEFKRTENGIVASTNIDWCEMNLSPSASEKAVEIL